MRIYVQTAQVSTCPIAHLGERAYLQLDLQLSDAQLYDAVYTLLGAMREPEAANLIRSEFPELLNAQEAV